MAANRRLNLVEADYTSAFISNPTTSSNRFTTSAPAKRRADSAFEEHQIDDRPKKRLRYSVTPQSQIHQTAEPSRTVSPTRDRAYRDFADFFENMDPGLRGKALEEIKDTDLSGEEQWRWQNYHPAYATEPCKIGFLLQLERRGQLKSRAEARGGKQKKGTGCEHACYRCYTFQPKACFEKQSPPIFVSRGRLVRASTGPSPDSRQCDRLLRRFCIQCGVSDGLYPKKAIITSMTDERWWVCDCRRLHWVSPNESYAECSDCHCKSGFRPFAQEELELSNMH